MKIQILDEARQDLVNGFRFYEAQSPGFGDYFLDSLFADIDSLQIYAGVHSMHCGYHRLLARRFPYAVYYRVADEVARVPAGRAAAGSGSSGTRAPTGSSLRSRRSRDPFGPSASLARSVVAGSIPLETAEFVRATTIRRYDDARSTPFRRWRPPLVEDRDAHP